MHCEFYSYSRYALDNAGECRRNPPKYGDRNKWPSVEPDQWCGEYKAKVDGQT